MTLCLQQEGAIPGARRNRHKWQQIQCSSGAKMSILAGSASNRGSLQAIAALCKAGDAGLTGFARRLRRLRFTFFSSLFAAASPDNEASEDQQEHNEIDRRGEALGATQQYVLPLPVRGSVSSRASLFKRSVLFHEYVE